MPGVVVTPAGVSDAGRFSSNGQRPNANAFRVDGASANTGVGGSILPGSFPGGSLPAMSAIGSTENLGTAEATQSVELRTSNFAPEWGGRPGAQALVVTRSGSNEFRGEFFVHERDNSWSARDWFANREGYPYRRPVYNSLGAVFGGPIRRNRTFFFASLERSTLVDTGMQLIAVPSLTSRQNAPDKLKPILDYFPYPTGPDLGGGEAASVLQNGTTARLANWSARVDHSLGSRGNLFFRVVGSPSLNTHLQDSFATGKLNWLSTTLGVTATWSGFVHDLRWNYSRATINSGGAASASATAVLVSSGLLPGSIVITPGTSVISIGQIPPELTALLPASSGLSQTVIGLSVPGVGQFISSPYGSGRQDQWELRDTLSRRMGRHEFRAGIDYILLEPSRDAVLNSVLGAAFSLQGLLDNDPLAVTYSQAARFGGRIHAVSVFAQDTFHLSESVNLVYGWRWEVTPPSANHVQIPTVSGLWTGTDWQTTHTGDINGAALWPMRYGQIAPRIGLAWRTPWSGLVLRAGGGVFYDATLGALVNPINGAPFNSWLLASASVDGATGTGAAPSPSGSMSADVNQFLNGAQASLHLPTSYQWRLSVERSAGTHGVASLAYLGAEGHHLLGNQAYLEPGTGILDRRTTVTESSSNYQAAQLRYTSTLGRGIYGSASYTWAHSIDDGSEDSSLFLIHPGYRLNEARGSSSFDVRQELSVALSYRLPRGGLPKGLRDWTVSGILRARGGFPIDVMNSEPPLGQGFDNAGRPDFVPGVPVWLADPSVAGHRRLNPAAFRTLAAGTTGTLGRNAISGNALTQLDISMRREFPISRRLSLEVALNIFNVTNHPAFANPVPYLSSPWFGQPTSMQNLMLGSGTPNTGLPPLFQTGGPRSGELNLRLSF